MTLRQKSKVQVYGAQAKKTIMVENGATEGATIGTDLRLPDGSVPTLQELAEALGIYIDAGGGSGGGSTGELAVTLWTLILEIPSDPLSVLGNPTNVEARPVAIVADLDGEILRRSGTTLDFGLELPGEYLFTNLVHFNDRLRIESASSGEWGEFSHDGTNLLLNTVDTDEWNISGPRIVSLLNPATDAIIFAESGAAGSYAFVGCENSESGAILELYAFGSADGGALYQDSAVLQFDDVASIGLYLRAFVSERRYAFLHDVAGAKCFDIQDGTHLRIFDGAETDSLDFFHDGTDFNTVCTNTRNWAISPLEEVYIGGLTTAHVLIGVECPAGATNFHAEHYASHAENNRYISIIAQGSTLAPTEGHYLYFSSDVGSLTIAGEDGRYLRFSQTTIAADRWIEADCVIITDASDTAEAGLRLPHGAAPTSPINGDLWTTTLGLYGRINGVTVGPYIDTAGPGGDGYPPQLGYAGVI